MPEEKSPRSNAHQSVSRRDFMGAVAGTVAAGVLSKPLAAKAPVPSHG